MKTHIVVKFKIYHLLLDIKECDDETLNKCTEKDTCLDTEGGYVCSCSPGFKLENDDRTCTGINYLHSQNNVIIKARFMMSVIFKDHNTFKNFSEL